MRFADVRPTVFKRTPADEGVSESAATPTRLSVRATPSSQIFKPGIEGEDILRETYNRENRRRDSIGGKKKRKRLRDNEVAAHWVQVRKAQKKMEENLEAKKNG